MFPFVFSALMLAAAPPAAQPVSDVLATDCEFGEVNQGKPADCLVEFVNHGDKAVHVSKIEALLPSDSVDTTAFDLPPGGTRQVKFMLDTGLQSGIVHRYLRFQTNDGKRVRAGKASGFIASILDDNQPSLDLGVVDLRESRRIPAGMKFVSSEVPTFRITKVVSAPAYVDIKIGEDGRSLEASVKDNAEWGTHDDYVRLAVDTPQQPTISFLLKANIHGDVVPSSNPFALGLMRRGNRNEFLIRLEDRTNTAVKLGKLTLDKLDGKVESVPCVPARKNCRDVKLTVADTQTTGMVNARIVVELPQHKRSMPILLWGIFVKADAEVRDLDKEMAEMKERPTADAGAAEGQSSAVGGQKFADLVKKAVKSGPVAEPSGTGPLVRWQVANEEGLYGYHVYRSDKPEGGFARVNGETIKTMGEDGGSSYAWRDASAVSGHTYWYYVGLVYGNGKKEPLSQPTKVVAK